MTRIGLLQRGSRAGEERMIARPQRWYGSRPGAAIGGGELPPGSTRDYGLLAHMQTTSFLPS